MFCLMAQLYCEVCVCPCVYAEDKQSRDALVEKQLHRTFKKTKPCAASS